MPFVAVPNTAEVDVIYNLFGQVIENTLYFVTTGGWDESALTQLAASVAAWTAAQLLPHLSADLIYRRTEAKDISTTGGFTAVNITGDGGTGGVSSPAAPGGTCLAVGFRTGHAGRSFRGRNYVSGLPSNGISGNQLISADVAAIQAAYNALPAAVHGDLPDAVWSVVSRVSGGVPRVAGVTTPITHAVCANDDLDSQRRRLNGRGI